ncbi:MAG: ATP-binding protein [Promethearchaeota archaeon]
MFEFPDLLYLVLILITTCFSITFFITRKREYSVQKFKYILIILLAISVIFFISNSISFLTSPSELLRSSEKVILNNISLFLLCFSISLFIYSLYSHTDDIIELKKPSFLESKKGNIKFGKIIENGHEKHNFFISLKDLEKHMFICGATGTGKTNFLQHFLMNFTQQYKIPFMVVEFKGEYHFLQKKIENLIILRPGENFSINIFNPEGALPEIHAERIFDILKSGKFLDENSEFSPQMEKVLVEILVKVCQHKEFQSWEGFYKYCKGYSTKKQKEIPMLSQTLISITNRIRRFSLGSLKALFETNHKLNVTDLFKRNVLFDLSSIIRMGGEKEDALFFLNMVLKYLWDKNLTQGAYNFQGIKHITIIEDSQYFAPKEVGRKNKLTTYLEDIALLQRGTGECLISLATHPEISEEILANCGILVCFKTHMEKDFLCKLLNLDPENEDYLSILEEGQCIVRVNSIKRPFLIAIPLIKRQWLTSTEIDQINESTLEEKKNLKSDRYNNLSKKIQNLKNKLKKFYINYMKKVEVDMKEDLNQKEKNYLGYYEPQEESEGIEDFDEKSRDFKKLKKLCDRLYVEQEKRKGKKSS